MSAYTVTRIKTPAKEWKKVKEYIREKKKKDQEPLEKELAKERKAENTVRHLTAETFYATLQQQKLI